MEKTRWIQPTRFHAQGPAHSLHGPFTVVAVVPGIEDGPLDLNVTNSLVTNWQAHCNVFAIVIFA